MEPKFKVGDKVVAVTDYEDQLTKGKVYTIIETTPDRFVTAGYWYRVVNDLGKITGYTYGARLIEFKNPKRVTVTDVENKWNKELLDLMVKYLDERIDESSTIDDVYDLLNYIYACAKTNGLIDSHFVLFKQTGDSIFLYKNENGRGNQGLKFELITTKTD